ncbi:hypothetical protein, partial [Microcoleus sp. PH2017_09_SFU_O_A]|uniref:hypothetical protein n=1 Tax=Microcoleus sp. PH2017_09_SFU_O_A TaxID=2798820 RepID=UPI0025FDFEA5
MKPRPDKQCPPLPTEDNKVISTTLSSTRTPAGFVCTGANSIRPLLFLEPAFLGFCLYRREFPSSTLLSARCTSYNNLVESRGDIIPRPSQLEPDVRLSGKRAYVAVSPS